VKEIKKQIFKAEAQNKDDKIDTRKFPNCNQLQNNPTAEKENAHTTKTTR
jgi:hypothetical protein